RLRSRRAARLRPPPRWRRDHPAREMPPEHRPAARWSCLSLSRLLQRRPDDPWPQPFQVARVDHPAWRLVGLTLKTMKVAAHGHHQAMLSGQLLVDRDLLRLVAAGVALQGIALAKDLRPQAP